MKKSPWLIILFLVLVIILQQLGNRKPNAAPETITLFDTIHDTVPYPVTQYVPKPVFIDTGSTRWKYHKVDTAAILKEYFAVHFYIDTLASDSLVQAVVFDSVSQNRIVFRKKQFTVFPQKVIITKSHIQLRSKLFLGFSLGKNPHEFSFGPSVLFASKKNQAYSFSYDFINKDFYFNIYWKLKFK